MIVSASYNSIECDQFLISITMQQWTIHLIENAYQLVALGTFNCAADSAMIQIFSATRLPSKRESNMLAKVFSLSLSLTRIQVDI